MEKFVDKINATTHSTLNTMKKIMQDVSNEQNNIVSETSNILDVIETMEKMKRKMEEEILGITEPNVVESKRFRIETLEKRITSMFEKLNKLDG